MQYMTKKEMKNEMLQILTYIDDICKKNNINYSLIGGSLIGAVREGGIIDWDDDIDIGLLKKDYDKLINILKKNDNNKYYLIYHDTELDYYSPHAKLVSLRTGLIEKDYQKIDNMGVFVDIFVYSYLPKNLILAKIFFYKIIIINKFIAGLRRPNRNESKYTIRLIRFIVCKKILGSNFIFRKANKLYSKYKNGNHVVVNLPLSSFEKNAHEVSFFNSFIRVKFEGKEFSIVKKYHEMLTQTFGDYMTPPPIKDRVNHNLKAYWKDKNDKKINQ